MNLDNYKLAVPDFFFDKEREYEHKCAECGFTVEENRKDCRLCYDCDQNYINSIEPWHQK